MGFHVNTGFYQTLEKYTTSNKYQPQFSGTLSSNNLKYEQGETQYLNNNVFLEFLPSYILNNTRIIGGAEYLQYKRPNKRDLSAYTPPSQYILWHQAFLLFLGVFCLHIVKK